MSAAAPEPLRVRAMGVPIAVDLPHTWLTDSDRRRLQAIWSHAQDPCPPADAESIPLRAPAVDHADSLHRLASALSTEVTLAALTEQAGRLLLLHAAGLADLGTGHTVALVAPSGTGKTTAARALGQRWGYVSDETVAVDPASLQVFPHPKPLSLGDKSRAKDQVGPDELRLRPAPETTALARIVLLTRDPDHLGPPAVEPVELGEALGALPPETSYLSHWDAPLTMMARTIVGTGGIVRARYTDATQLVDLAGSLLTEHVRAEEWSPVADDRVHDAVATDEALVLMSAHDPAQVVVLAGIGPTVWGLTRDPRASFADVVAGTVAVHGEPASASAEHAVRACLDELRAHHVLAGRHTA